MKMSVEEAQLILNVKKGDSMEKILEVSIILILGQGIRCFS